MEKHIRKIVSALLCMSMLLTVASPCFAAEEGTNGSRSYFDFEASEYEVGENDGELKIKIVRHGEGNAEADVAFKVADFLSSYGEDYAVLDGKGKQLQKVYGEKPSVSDLVYEGNTDELVNIPSADEIKEEESAQGAADEDVPEAVEESGDALEEETTIKEADSDETAQVAEVAETEEALPENLDKKAKSTGSSLRDAQSAYLNITKSEENKETESAIKDTLDDLYNYFLSAEGAEGKVHFKKGQNEKTITIKLFDNNVSEQDKIFLIALMGTDNDETMIAANATTYVTIIDDEKVEKSQFDLAEEKITLTKDAPEAYVTVRRSGGTQYFATVYVSTVKNTADEDAYEGFDYKPVAFVPGETEKKVKITAKSFDKDAGFGLRLEAESAYDIGNHYTAVKISQKSEAQGETAQKGISLMAASNVTLGSSSDTYDTDIPGGWESEIEIKTSPFGGRKVPSDGKAWVDEKNGNLCVMNKDVNKRSVWISKEEQNLIGVKNVTFRSRTWNFSNRPKKIRYWTVFEVGSSCNTLYGNSDWGERTLSRGSKDSGYISFWVRPKETGDNDPAAELDWVRFNNALYTFNLNNSLETVKRKMYDFTQGSPKEYDILFDGESTRIYNPGGITIYRNNGDTVSSFYSNNTEQVTIRSSKEAANNRNGIYLKGVYFTYSDMSDSNMYKNGKYATNNVYYLAASGGAVKFTPNKDFIKTLYDYGVIACKDCDKTIKIYPVFGQDTVWVNFENTDRDDKNAATKGKFDSSHKCSFIDNILEACNSGKVTKCLYNGWLDYYTMSVPKGSIIRVRTMPISTRTANGVHWWYHSGSNNGTTYHKAGDKIASATVVGGEPVTETKYDIADIYAGENLSMKPVTGAQTVDVAYYPKEKDYIPEEYKGEDGLKNAVIVSNALTGSSQEVKGTDKNGDYTVPNPQIGMLWSFTAFAPEGYYTQWVNMTGDENKDGEIDAKEAANLRYDPDKKYNMPLHVYGNRISGKLDQDNLRLNYFFLPRPPEEELKRREELSAHPKTSTSLQTT